MKILIVTDAYFPQVNGVVRTLNETGKKLEAHGSRLVEYIKSPTISSLYQCLNIMK